jgi:hypothetical protein
VRLAFVGFSAWVALPTPAFCGDRPLSSYRMIEPAQTYAEAQDRFQRETRIARLDAIYRSPSPGLNQNPYWGAIQFAVATIALERRSLHNKDVYLLPGTLTSLGLTTKQVACAPDTPNRQCVSVDDLIRAVINQEHSNCKEQPLMHVKSVNGCANLSYSVLARLYHLSTQNPVGSPYRLSPETELRMRQYFFLVLKLGIGDREYSPAANAAEVFKEHATSENHITTGQGMLYFAAYHLQRSADHGDKILPNGLSVREAYSRYRNHWVMKTREYIKRGLLIETNSHKYNKYTLSMIVTLADIAPDDRVREGARDLVDLIFLQAAVETLPNGVRGGTQSRKSPGETASTAAQLHLLYSDEDSALTRNEALSGGFFGGSQRAYFPPEVIWKVWRHASKANSYEVQSRVPGVLKSVGNDDLNPLESSYRNTYVTPSFSLGSYRLDMNRLFYGTATSEARGMSLHVNEEPGSGGFSEVGQVLFGPGQGACFDKVVGLQKKGALIFQNSIEFHLRGHHSDVHKLWGPRDCFGWGGAKTNPRTITSFRTLPDKSRLDLSFVDADHAIRQGAHIPGPGRGEGNDVTRNFNDIEISRSFRLSTSPQKRREILLASPGGTTFVWIKALASDIDIGGDHKAYSRVKLTTDKFSPVVVLAAPAANFDGDLGKFDREKNLGGKLTYIHNRVTFQPSLRATLEAGDVFVDSSVATPLAESRGTWRTATSADVHDRHSLVTEGYDSAVTFPVTVERDGTYYLKIRAAGVKSVGLRINDEQWKVADVSNGLPEMKWVNLSVFDGEQGGVRVNRVRLNRGTHRITLVFRKVGVELDALALQLARNEVPAELEFQELLDRNQAPSLVNGELVEKSFKHAEYTFFSPFARALKDSGRWEIRYGSSSLLIDYSAPVRVRREGAIFPWQ